ncbi:hypothetical protein [Stieleria magnilauensis]|uniref:hypothetical protein n=1 Tax=Stieleria magnilauensis TaxID=2527963 RepID=UPI003AF77BB3
MIIKGIGHSPPGIGICTSGFLANGHAQPSLMEQTVKSAVVYTRGDSGFLRQEYGAGERFELPIETLTLELDRAYEGLAI